MTRAWTTLERQATTDGVLELRQRDADDFVICIGGRILMNSRSSRSETELGIRACQSLRPEGRVLVGGLGMGLTLRAVLDTLGPNARVTVAERHPVMVEWCRGPLAGLSKSVLDDSRLTLYVGDVADCIREASAGGEPYDAIVLDLFEGPHAATDAAADPFYGRLALERSWRALTPGGVLGVWSEAPEKHFERRLAAQGFGIESHRPGRGGLRHWIVLARRPKPSLGR